MSAGLGGAEAGVTLGAELLEAGREARRAQARYGDMASTHEAFGVLAEIVVELKRRNWSDQKIGRELGMDPDEVLRLTQITGLAEMFKDREFSEAWEAETPTQINELDDLAIEDEGGDESEPE